MTELDDTGRELVGRLVELTGQISELTEAAEAIKDELRQQYGVGSFTSWGEKAVSITPNRRFNAERAIQVLPPELVALCTVPAVVSTVARRNLPAALYDQCMVEVGKPVVRLA